MPHEIRLTRRSTFAYLVALALLVLTSQGIFAQSDPLPSWNDGAVKKSIVDFVSRVTTQGGADFVPAEQRIATFDNDGTLWCEQPVYFQVAFAFDRIKAMAPQHPEWKTTQLFKALLEKDMKAFAATGEKGLLQIMAATHTGITIDEFSKTVVEWTTSARHPRFNRPYTQLVYQPMLELLACLRANGFKTFVVSGGGVEFMRPWMEKVPVEANAALKEGDVLFRIDPVPYEARVKAIEAQLKLSDLRLAQMTQLFERDSGRAFDVQQRRPKSISSRRSLRAPSGIWTRRWCGRRPMAT
jgi:phosphoserine phosphatase